MKGSTQVCRELARNGIRDVFGLAGDGNYRYIAQLPDVGISFRPARHETAAISMADGYARATGAVGVCTVTHGPGLTHAISSLVEVRKSHSPVVLLASDTPTWPTAYSCQDLDQLAVLNAIGLRTERVPAVGTLARDLSRAFAFASQAAEPIALLIPTDVQDDACEYRPATIRGGLSSPPSADDVEALAHLVSSAERPLLLAGRGSLRPDARRTLECLADRGDMLLGTTALATGLFPGNPFSLGVVGGFASPATREIIAEADLVLCFGGSFSTWTTLSGRIISPEATLVQVDRDPAALSRHAPIALGIAADVTATAEALCAALPSPTDAGRQRSPATARRIRAASELPFDDVTGNGLVDPRLVIDRLDSLLPRGRTICIDGGWHGSLPVQRLTCPDAQGFVFSQTYQCVGIGIGTAIGAAIGRPDRLAVLVCGDGGLSMSMAELVTAAHCGRPLLVVVINDGAYAAEVEGLSWLGLPTDAAYLTRMDFVATARAVGGDGIAVRCADDLERLQPWLASPSGLFVVDCKVPCPIDYGRGGEADWIEHIWHEPRPSSGLLARDNIGT